MATKKSQRIAIWVIAVTLTVGTIGSFLVMALASQNEQQDQIRLQEAYQEYQTRTDERNSKLSDKYYPVLKKYEDMPAKFDAKSVKKLTHKDLKVGDGETVSDDTKLAMYYIGWKPNGEVFDQSIEGDALKDPLFDNVGLEAGLGNASLIEGWKEGLKGMKLHGVRLLTIPSDMAYGEQESEDIPANTPLKFVVLAIPAPEEIPIPKILEQYYGQM